MAQVLPWASLEPAKGVAALQGEPQEEVTMKSCVAFFMFSAPLFWSVPALAQAVPGPVVAVPPGAATPTAPSGSGAASAEGPTSTVKSQTELEAGIAALVQKTNELSAGNLIQYGLTGGLALTLQVTTGVGLDNRSLYGASAAVLPYIMLHPGYLKNDKYDGKRAYCAKRWQGSGFRDASEAALADAMDKARRTYFSLLQLIARNYGTTDIMCAKAKGDAAAQSQSKAADLPSDAGVCKRYNIANTDLEAIKAVYHDIYLQNTQLGNRSSPVATAKEPITDLGEIEKTLQPRERDVIASIAHSYWNPLLAPNCSQYNFGLWAGLGGLPYTAQIVTKQGAEQDDTRDNRTLTPIIAGGVGYSPNTYLSILVGVTYSLIVEGKPDGGTTTFSLLTPTIGLAGSINIFSALTKK